MLDALEHSFQGPAYLLRIIVCYLKDCALMYKTKEGERNVTVTPGVA